MLHPYFAGFGSRRDERPMILGHRGAAGCAPENTLLSFECCLEQGGDAIESDVQVTRDGTPVLLHDADVGRVSGVAAIVESLPLAELERIDAGHHFTIDERGRTEPDDDEAFRDQGHQVPTVEAAFETFPDARFNLEIKTGRGDAVAKVVELVARFDRADRTLLTAGDDEIMKVLREELTKRGVPAATSASISDVVAVVRSAVDDTPPPPAIHALQIPTHFGDNALVTPELIAHAHRHGVHVHVWTINETAEMERLLDLGVDGLVTDFPGRMAAVLAARAARP
jgi:glycerophosphoryl diester phosphodiesterase